MYELPKRKTYNGLKVLERHGLVVFEEYFKKKATIIVLVTHKTLSVSLAHDDQLRLIVTTILRTYEGIHNQETAIDIEKIANILNLKPSEIISHLNTLDAKEILKFKTTNTDAQITFGQPREDDKAINRISKEVNTQNKIKHKKIQAVIDYIENNSICKSQQLLTYFGEPQSKACGTCNVCLQNNTQPNINFQKENVDLVLKTLKTQPLNSRELASNLSLSSNEIIAVLGYLLEQEKIEHTQTNQYQIKCP